MNNYNDETIKVFSYIWTLVHNRMTLGVDLCVHIAGCDLQN